MFIHTCLTPQQIWALCITLLAWWVIIVWSILSKFYSNAMGKKKQQQTSLHCLWSWPELGRVWKTAASVQSKSSYVTELERPRPKHVIQTGTTACTCDPNQAELAKRMGKILKKPLWPGTATLCPLCHTAHLLWQGVTWLLSGFHPDSRIFTKDLSVLGIVHRKPKHRQCSLILLRRRHVGKYNLMRFVCFVSVLLYFKQEERLRGR